MLKEPIGKLTLATTGLCALLIAAAPLASAQPGDEGSPPDGKAGGPPASTAGAEPGDPAAQQAVEIVVDGGKFSGSVYFAAPGSNHGGFVFSGTSDDTSNNDQEVYLEVAVEGYSPNEFRNPVDKDKTWNQVVWDPAAVHTDHARMRICNSDAFWDTCSDWRSFTR
ncbi:hypothetical protein [Nocardia sp. BMG51109]|uniref:hypothetical protein n=1 Tax=Nocardia sp. BMG51109 TaxID=1056816 RepID=UPI000466FBFF|nr:hypothetical protein [Nocardia sp. BMG51109]